MSDILENTSIEHTLTSDLEQNLALLTKNDSDILKNIRQEAIEALNELGLPSKKDELWRFTDVRKWFENSGKLMHPFLPPDDVNTPIKEIFRCDVSELDTFDLALINGWYPKTLPMFQRLDNGSVVGSFAEAKDLYNDIIDQYFGKIANHKKDALTALNTAFNSDGIFAWFPENTKMEKPVQIVNLVSQEENSFFQQLIQPRNLVVVEKNAHVKLVICDHTLSNNKSLTNAVTEIFVDEGATLEIYSLQNQNNLGALISTIHIEQKDRSNVTVNTITLNGGFVRNNTTIIIDGEYAEANIFGTHLTDRTQHVDNNTFIDHRKPNSNSNELFKAILDDEATGVFRGQIKVRKDAQNTNSYQKNNNLLLTDNAKMNAMPQLEIYADDVKCSHGATVGYLGVDELFYLRSRGIGEKEARLLLMNAFVGEIIEKIKIPALRDRITYLVAKRLRGELSHCATCVLNCRE
ncbi:MAG: Fe-S cluster assembly protein SufD [Cytophagia bacterium]|nr:Fe-S cluster assembly protein SufD [Cytophagia bacterium]